MISLFLLLLALLATGLTWRQFTSVANRHRHRIIYSCGHRSSRPHLLLATGTGQFPVVFGLLALFGLLAGHRSDYRKIGSWHRSGTGLWGTGEAVQDRDYGTGTWRHGRLLGTGHGRIFGTGFLNSDLHFIGGWFIGGWLIWDSRSYICPTRWTVWPTNICPTRWVFFATDNSSYFLY